MQEEFADIVTEIVGFLKTEPEIFSSDHIAVCLENARKDGDDYRTAVWHSRQLIGELRETLRVAAEVEGR